MDVAMLYNPATIDIIKKEFIPVKLDDRIGKPTRDILYCQVRVFSLDTLHLYINHWPSRGGGQLETESLRIATALKLKGEINGVTQHYYLPKIIIMGDLNDEPDDRSLLVGLQAQTERITVLPESLYNLAAGYAEENKTGSYKFKGRWEMLDQIIVTGRILNAGKGIQTSAGKFSVFSAPFLLVPDDNYQGYEPFRTYNGPVYKGGFSDHLPVVLDMGWKETNEMRGNR
jgi:endonuclease/exonuclease/phosphatase family metal-dependent hydrolase